MPASSSISSSEAPPAGVRADRAGLLRDLALRVAPILALPVLHCVLVLLADPYRVFDLPWNITTDAVYRHYAEPANPALAVFTRFRNAPKPDIVLGDSRMRVVEPAAVKEQTGLDIANLAIPGGTFETTIDAFWLASEQVRLRSVTIGVSLDSYNDFRIGSEIPAVRGIEHNPLLYCINRNVIESSIEAYRNRMGFQISNRFQLSRLTKEQIWQGGRNYFRDSIRNWREPVRYRAKLRDIAAYCRTNGVDLQFAILPQQDEATHIIQEFGLMDAYAAVKRELAQLATLRDLSESTPLTADRDRFTDLLHFGPEKDFRVISRIWPGR